VHNGLIADTFYIKPRPGCAEGTEHTVTRKILSI
jgi:hypothetical protein